MTSNEPSAQTRNLKNIKLVLEYDGTNYHGWQLQKDLPTIQGTLQQAIYQLTKTQVTVYGSGRTDAGVHALAQVANFHTNAALPEHAWVKALNAHLPSDIIIKEALQVPFSFHAQFSAVAKTYVYRIYAAPHPRAIGRQYFHWVWQPLDLTAMRQAARYLIGRHDFSAFEAAFSPRKSSVRTVKKVDIQTQGCYIEVTVTADGFLYRMVRNIVGTLLEVGRQRYPAKEIVHILQSRQRSRAGPTAPAKGLFLQSVQY